MPRKPKADVYKTLDLVLIDRPNDIARLDISQNEIMELAASIKAQGLLQPILVTPRDGRFEIVAGDRRFLAHKYLKEQSISCKVVYFKPKEVALARAMENIQRKDLSPVEEAKQYKGLIDNFNLDYDKIGDLTGVSGGVVKRRVSLLHMPDNFLDALHKKLITQTVAEELFRCPDNTHRNYLFGMAVDHGVTKEIARSWVDDYLKSLRSGPSAGTDSDLDASVLVDRPVYVTCELCGGPVDVRKARNFTACPECATQLKRIIESNPT